MKKTKITLIITLALALIIPISAFAAQNTNKYALDNAGLMADTEVSDLESALNELSAKYGFDIVALTVDSLDGKTPMAYADDYYDYNGYREDGCLFLVSMEDRDWWISTKGYGITAITDYGIEVIENEVVHYLSDGEYYKAFSKYASVVEEFIVEAKSGKAYDVDNKYSNVSGYTYDFSDDYSSKEDDSAARQALIVSLIVALIVAGVIVKMVRAEYKPVRFNVSAKNYLVDGSLIINQSYEHFLFSNVTKTEIESKSSSGGGSSTHSSSSGSSHGGGGGKF